MKASFTKLQKQILNGLFGFFGVILAGAIVFGLTVPGVMESTAAIPKNAEVPAEISENFFWNMVNDAEAAYDSTGESFKEFSTFEQFEQVANNPGIQALNDVKITSAYVTEDETDPFASVSLVLTSDVEENALPINVSLRMNEGEWKITGFGSGPMPTPEQIESDVAQIRAQEEALEAAEDALEEGAEGEAMEEGTEGESAAEDFPIEVTRLENTETEGVPAE